MKYDTTLKDLLWRGAPALLRQLVGVPAAELLPTEFPATRNRHPDLLARLTDGRLFHLELQSGPDERMPWRMLEYYGLIADRHGGEPVVQRVLALTAPAAAALKTGIAHPNLRFGYDVVGAEDLDAEALLASDRPDDQILAVLCRTDDMRVRVRTILEHLLPLDGRERRDAVIRLLVLGGLRGAVPVVMEEVGTMGIQIDIEENEYLKSVFLKGQQAGKAQGKAEGKAEGQAELLLKQLERRFGAVPDSWRQVVRAAPPERVEAWGEAIFDADSLESLLGRP